jgi:uncharacterized SAM-binding protein YcdF (DUF218 family)
MNQATNSPDKKEHSFFKGCSIFLLVSFLLVLLFWVGLVASGAFLIVGDRVKPVDAIVVLSGDDGERVQEAVRWYKQSPSRYMVFTKTHTEDIGEGRTYSESLMRLAIDSGVPQDSMLVTAGEASSTIEEAEAVKTLAQQRKITSILVVTAPYHTRRTELIFDRVFRDTEIKVLVHAVENSWYKPLTWYLDPQGWRQTLAEYGSLFLIWMNR